MTILTDFKTALASAINDYEISRRSNIWPFKRTVSLIRANDIAQLQNMMNEAVSASSLRYDVENKMDNLKVGSFSGPAYLDMHALEVRINKVLKMRQFNEAAIDRKENREMRTTIIELSVENRELIEHINTLKIISPEKFSEIEALLQEYAGKCQLLDRKVEILTVNAENMASELEKSQQQVSALEAKLEDNKTERDTLSRNNIILLQQTRELKEANEALKAQVAALEQENALLVKNTTKAPVNDVKKPPAPSQGTSFLPGFFRRS